MRTVTGPSDRVVVVGAGLAGLSAALHLLAAGREVTVLERGPVVGGRCGRFAAGGYEFDTGPTVLTLPDVVAEAFGAVGEDLDDWLELRRLDPAYRAFFPDTSRLDVYADIDAMTDEVGRVCGTAEAAGYRRLVGFLSRMYRLQVDDFIGRNLDSPLAALTPRLAALAAAGGFGRLGPRVERYLSDPRTRRVFSFQALYAGLSPYDALALYGVIPYMDTVAGVYWPIGGMHAVPTALAAAAEKHGATIRCGVEVSGVELAGRRARAVRTSDGERIPADAVVLTPDLPVAWRTLLGDPPRRHARLRHSPSCVLLQLGSRAAYPQTAHHTIHFGRSWRGVFDELITAGRPMTDPSLLVTNPTRTDPASAPAGRHTYHVVAPAPNTDSAVDWTRLSGPYRDELVRTLAARGYVGLDDSIEVERVVTPADWAAEGLERGTPFAAAHTLAQTGPFRSPNLPRQFENVVLAGSGTHPGVGVPMVLVSGRLASARVTGLAGR